MENLGDLLWASPLENFHDDSCVWAPAEPRCVRSHAAGVGKEMVFPASEPKTLVFVYPKGGGDPVGLSVPLLVLPWTPCPIGTFCSLPQVYQTTLGVHFNRYFSCIMLDWKTQSTIHPTHMGLMALLMDSKMFTCH